MEKEGMVTVVLLVYKNTSYIQEALQSVYIQDYKNIELIISDDCSPDINRDFFERIRQEAEKRVKSVVLNINDKNMGTVRHLNKLVKMASGDLICPLACDDKFYDERVITDLVAYAKKSKSYVFTAKRVCVDASSKKELFIKPTIPEANLLEQEPAALFNYMAVYGSFISGACTYYKKSVFKKYGYFDESCRLVEDYAYYLRLLLQNERIAYLDRITIQYRWGGVSTGKKMNPIVYDDMGTILKTIIYPNRNMLKNWNKRVVELRYKRRFLKENKLCLYLKYIDIILFWAFQHAMEIVKGKK